MKPNQTKQTPPSNYWPLSGTQRICDTSVPHQPDCYPPAPNWWKQYGVVPSCSMKAAVTYLRRSAVSLPLTALATSHGHECMYVIVVHSPTYIPYLEEDWLTWKLLSDIFFILTTRELYHLRPIFFYFIQMWWVTFFPRSFDFFFFLFFCSVL